jgi:hypothetical protein
MVNFMQPLHVLLAAEFKITPYEAISKIKFSSNKTGVLYGDTRFVCSPASLFPNINKDTETEVVDLSQKRLK